MSKNNVLIPVDFTAAAARAVLFGVTIAKKMNSGISLLHVFEDDGLSVDACETKLRQIARQVQDEHGIETGIICKKGNIFSVIPAIASDPDYLIMVIATHGAKGIRQKVFGPDILKLLKKVCLPALVVQKDSLLPADGINSALLPVGGHDEYDRMIDSMITIAGLFDPEIHLYSIVKPGFEQSDNLRKNISMAETRFAEKGIHYKRVAEDQQVFSVGFAKQSIQYAKRHDLQLISIMVNATRENYYFADSDKQSILTNELNIPVLCASNAVAER